MHCHDFVRLHKTLLVLHLGFEVEYFSVFRKLVFDFVAASAESVGEALRDVLKRVRSFFSCGLVGALRCFRKPLVSENLVLRVFAVGNVRLHAVSQNPLGDQERVCPSLNVGNQPASERKLAEQAGNFTESRHGNGRQSSKRVIGCNPTPIPCFQALEFIFFAFLTLAVVGVDGPNFFGCEQSACDSQRLPDFWNQAPENQEGRREREQIACCRTAGLAVYYRVWKYVVRNHRQARVFLVRLAQDVFEIHAERTAFPLGGDSPLFGVRNRRGGLPAVVRPLWIIRQVNPAYLKRFRRGSASVI